MQKPFFLWLLLFLFTMPSWAQDAHINQRTAGYDSLFYKIYETAPGNWAGFEFERFGAEPFDATGDGVPELITIDDSQGSETVQVIDLTTDTEVLALSMNTIRQRMLTMDYSAQEAADLKFRGFFQFIDHDLDLTEENNSTLPRAVLFMTQGAPVIYDPSNDNLIGLQPEQWRVFAISDFDGDGWPDIVAGHKDDRIIEIHGSRSSPGFK